MTSEKSVREQVHDILKFSKQDDQIYLKMNNIELYKYRFESNFPEFNEKYPTIMKKIINGDDLKYLNKMLDALDQIDNNETTKTDAEKKIGEELAEEYIYPLINKK